MECKYCKEEIQQGAIKCKHCGEMQNSGVSINATAQSDSANTNDVPSGFNCFIYALKNYANFSGRARRREYWMFILFYVLISLVLVFIDGMTGTFNAGSGMGLLGGLYALGMLVPSFAVMVRRLHDTEKSGWWSLIILIPLVGVIVLLVFLCMDSKTSQNKFGLSRKISMA